MTVYSVKQLLSDKIKIGSEITLKGWVRNRRDSKAGISFISISDGSCFAALQVVAGSNLANYTTEVLSLTKDCALIVKGQLVASAGSGQQVEVQAQQIQVTGWVENPETYPISPKRHSVEYLPAASCQRRLPARAPAGRPGTRVGVFRWPESKFPLRHGRYAHSRRGIPPLPHPSRSTIPPGRCAIAGSSAAPATRPSN